MPTSSRVRRDEFTTNCEAVGDFMVDFVRGKWRIYEHWSDYTSVSGGIIRKGKVIRRYDPEAGQREGLPAAFDSKADAVAYAERWLRTKQAK